MLILGKSLGLIKDHRPGPFFLLHIPKNDDGDPGAEMDAVLHVQLHYFTLGGNLLDNLLGLLFDLCKEKTSPVDVKVKVDCHHDAEFEGCDMFIRASLRQENLRNEVEQQHVLQLELGLKEGLWSKMASEAIIISS